MQLSPLVSQWISSGLTVLCVRPVILGHASIEPLRTSTLSAQLPCDSHTTQCTSHSQALCSTVLVFGVANRVLYRMALVPMRDYVFFLAQLQNISYLAVYFLFLYLRIRYDRAPQGAFLQGASERH